MRENILEKHPNADLRVYTVWLPMLVTDDRGEWNPNVFADARVRDYWDGDRDVGRWFAEQNVGGLGYAGVVWDAYLLYGPGDALADPVASGSPVVDSSDRLAEAFSEVERRTSR